jgi:hypothetical protein
MSEEQFEVQAEQVAGGGDAARSFDELPTLWLKLFQMTEEFFAREAPSASGKSTFLSVLVLAGVTAVFSAISALIGGGIAAALGTVEAQGASVVQAALTSFCGGILSTVIGFYLGSGIFYVLARIFGGQGDFSTQSYLLSLFEVPLGIVVAVLSLVSAIPVAGTCIAGIASLGVSAYTLILLVRALKVAHDMTTGRVVTAVLVPVVILLLVPCLVILALTLMGPAVGSVFSNIVLEI